MLLDRRAFMAAALASAAMRSKGSASVPRAEVSGRIPVVLATDIGGDIDDTWALALVLKCPELDLKLAVTEYGNPVYRAQLLAKFLQSTGYGNIPIALGPHYEDTVSANDGALARQAAWLKGYELNTYRGPIYHNGPEALVEVIMKSPVPITVIAIGPAPTLAEALVIEPRIAERARVVGMFGSIRVGYDGAPIPVPEGNVVRAIGPAQRVLSAPWEITITPLDTCGLVTLEGARYQRLLRSKNSIASAVIDNYRIWSRSTKYVNLTETKSSVLFDPVAVYLAIAEDFCKMERLKIRVTEDGLTKIDPLGTSMKVATEWRNLEGFKDFLVERLLS